METAFEVDGPEIKKPYNLKNIFFIIYLPRTITINTASSIKIDTNNILYLPKKAKAFITSKFRGQEIYEINKEKNRLWIEILNTSYTENFKTKKKTPLGFLVTEPENLKFKYGKKKRSTKATGLPKNAGRDTVNQVDKIASGKNYWRNRQNCTKKDKSSYQVWRRRD